MKKIQYIAPELLVVTLSQTDGIMLSGSDEERSLLGNGGGTGSAGVTVGDVKRSDYNVWNDDWSK